MKKHLFFSFYVLLSINILSAQNDLKPFFDTADNFFQKNIENGRVDYRSIKDNPQELNALVKIIENANIKTLSKEIQKAFWINAYNILTIKGIVNNYPTISPKKIIGFFDVKKHKAAGEYMTLNDIENKKLRAKYKDPRIHFVLVCAALGCPKIGNFAYKPGKLDVQLNEQVRQTVNDRNFIRLKNTDKKVEISELFKWYKTDFTAVGKGIIQFINEYRIHSRIPSNYTVGYYTYDWRLNEKKD